ncbi:MAG: aspartyl/asparaginyl beta-hydroxylase domain-containing protein [Parcubacteria group bacterium]|nr:aspartyl/asparaginyl beta-hydroxylase domain-containing protein [Parcubacteria group bacterium]
MSSKQETIEQIRKKLDSLSVPKKELERLYAMLDISLLPVAQQPKRPALQVPHYLYMPGLKARPFHDKGQFAFVTHLENAYADIKREFDLVNKQELVQEHRETKQNVIRGAWGEFNIYNLGKRSALSALAPRTLEVLQTIPGTTEMGFVYFSVLYPKTFLRAHFAPFNFRLRIHLPLYVPPMCGMQVAWEEYAWQEGICVVFDDSFQHAAWNKSNLIRVVLLVDFWHPDVTKIERQALSEILKSKILKF